MNHDRKLRILTIWLAALTLIVAGVILKGLDLQQKIVHHYHPISVIDDEGHVRTTWDLPEGK